MNRHMWGEFLPVLRRQLIAPVIGEFVSQRNKLRRFDFDDTAAPDKFHICEAEFELIPARSGNFEMLLRFRRDTRPAGDEKA